MSNNLGVISEIVMSSECLTKPNYNLFFESNVGANESERGSYWYKLAFSKDCFLKLTLIPNNENDRYNVSLYSTKRNENFCDEHEKIEDIEELVTFSDNHQSETFRKSIFYSKVIEVYDNEAIYIFINNRMGADSGHILEVQTCDDYSYILKVNKPAQYSGLATNNSQPLDLDVPKKICTLSDTSHFGYVSFNNNKIVVNNFTSEKIESINTANNKLLAEISALTELPQQTTDSLNGQLVLNDTLPKTNLKNSAKDSAVTANTKEIEPFTDFFKIFHKISDKNETYYELSDAYSNYLHITENVFPDDKSNVKTSKGPRTKRGVKKTTKLIPLNFIGVDTETGIVLKQASFKLLKESGLRPLPYTYNESIGVFSAETEADETYRIECDLIGYKNYAQRLDVKNKIIVDSTAFYIIPLSPLKAGDKFVIPNIYFHPNAPAFKGQSYEELNKLAKYMTNNDMNILIAGHTNGNKRISKDKRQTDENLVFKGSAKKLSRKRAEAVQEFLVKSGIDKSRIAVKGYGGKKPIIKNPKNKKESEKNMRVEIFITKF